MFLKNLNPMPSLDKLIARHVGLVLSKIFTPLAISVVIAVLDSSNTWLKLSSQWNAVAGLSKYLNGGIRSVMLKAYAA